jgi:hypothetical protein
MSLKLTKPQGHVVFVLLMCLMMSGAMSLVMAFLEIGFRDRLVGMWTKNWVIGFVVAVPAAFVAVPVARWMAASITK